jgi:hypothetical protein
MLYFHARLCARACICARACCMCAQLGRDQKEAASSVEGELVMVQYLEMYWSDLEKQGGY